jgi:uncharacterized protein YndB with AHSA1/START domain
MMEQSGFGWPVRDDAPSPGVRIETGVSIARPAEKVFACATAPVLWHTWHPATARVRDVPDHPLVTGETVIETITVGWRQFEACWTVLACEPSRLWVIATDNDDGTARIVYRVTPAGEGCTFHRTLDYRSKTWPWKMLDPNFSAWVLQRQSARALRNLKRVLEAPAE